jgi:hypothetical protein
MRVEVASAVLSSDRRAKFRRSNGCGHLFSALSVDDFFKRCAVGACQQNRRRISVWGRTHGWDYRNDY